MIPIFLNAMKLSKQIELVPLRARHERFFSGIYQDAAMVSAFEQAPMQARQCKREFQLRLKKWHIKSDFPLTFAINLDGIEIGLASIHTGLKVEVVQRHRSAFLTILIKEGYQNRGHGSKSLKLILNKSRSLGYKLASANISTNNTISIGMFEKFGVVADSMSYEKKNNHGEPYHWMYFAKDL